MQISQQKAHIHTNVSEHAQNTHSDVIDTKRPTSNTCTRCSDTIQTQHSETGTQKEKQDTLVSSTNYINFIVLLLVCATKILTICKFNIGTYLGENVKCGVPFMRSTVPFKG